LADMDIYKKSLDARENGEPFFVYSVDVLCGAAPKGRANGRGLSIIRLREEEALASLPLPTARLDSPPVVVGAGPAGLFAALYLAEAGFSPILVEQGQPVEQRARDVEKFWRYGLLDCHSNVQFGEGGAGAFSDGKLTFRGKDKLARQVLQTLISLGAPPEILYWHKPHLGSDKLQEIIPRLRQRIIASGGIICFATRLSGLLLQPCAGRRAVSGVRLEGAYSGEIPARAVILAPGNCARPTFRMLEQCGVALAAKPFAVGLRIEHSQSFIDKAQYGSYAGHAALPKADYQLKYKAADGRGFYSFCMCPGGHIVNASSEPDCLVINGVSMSARASGRANSAIVGAVSPGLDFADDPLAALKWQQKLEKSAYIAGGSDHAAPVCLVEDYLRGWGATAPPPEFVPMSVAWRSVELRPLLPEAVAEGLALALRHWQNKIKGFGEQAVLAAVESRTSSPVRILRDPYGQSINVAGLYPAGEGAGYAGGILSSAIDGLHAVAAIREKYIPPHKDFVAAFLKNMDLHENYRQG
ncbi:MAG: FAD-binding protein, partial [Clostridiales bacterium]|nr:FAD-binding protein [Clostridiales bacterium]